MWKVIPNSRWRAPTYIREMVWCSHALSDEFRLQRLNLNATPTPTCRRTTQRSRNHHQTDTPHQREEAQENICTAEGNWRNAEADLGRMGQRWSERYINIITTLEAGTCVRTAHGQCVKYKFYCMTFILFHIDSFHFVSYIILYYIILYYIILYYIICVLLFFLNMFLCSFLK